MALRPAFSHGLSFRMARISLFCKRCFMYSSTHTYRKLDEEKERLYQKYGEVKKELADYGIIKQNVDSILRVTPHQERTQEL